MLSFERAHRYKCCQRYSDGHHSWHAAAVVAVGHRFLERTVLACHACLHLNKGCTLMYSVVLQVLVLHVWFGGQQGLLQRMRTSVPCRA